MTAREFGLSRSQLGGLAYRQRPGAMTVTRRMSLAEFTRLHFASRALDRAENQKTEPPPAPIEEDKHAAQVVAAILKSRA